MPTRCSPLRIHHSTKMTLFRALSVAALLLVAVFAKEDLPKVRHHSLVLRRLAHDARTLGSY
jgi:hypothetical protein